MTYPTILALDLAASCGYALGKRGQPPYTGCLQLPFDASEGAGFAGLVALVGRLAKRERPNIIAVEQRLVSMGGKRGGTNDQALKRLYGLHAVAAVCADRLGASLREESVHSVRAWCLPNIPKAERGKPEIWDWCKASDLAASATLYDETDAAALWAYVAGWPTPGLDV